MPQPAYRDSRFYNSNVSVYESTYSDRRFSDVRLVSSQADYYRVRNIKPNQKKIKRNLFIHKVISFVFFTLVAVFVIPFVFDKFVKSIPQGSKYANITMDYDLLVHPIETYLSNDLSLGVHTIIGANKENPKMLPLKENYSMNILRSKLLAVQEKYPSIHSSVYVWDYSDGNYVNINADEVFSAASIIKLPVLVALFKNIELGQTSIYDEMVLTDVFRAEGSGGLQYKAENSKYSIDTLARIMITNSDNSATNMLMSKIGGMPAVNRQIKDWGLGSTYISNWLPDMEGSNFITSHDIARLLYNLDNPNFLSSTSREKIFAYMAKVKNDRLIPAGLGKGADFLHKTGDIGKMLGDAGIVIAPNGKKYIVVILANRPYNSVKGKEFIVEASDVIYKYLVRG